MEKVNYLENSENFVGWLIVSALTDSEVDMNEFTHGDQFNASELEVKMSINGFDVPVMKTLNDIEKQMNRMVYEKALEIVNNKYGDIINLLSDMEERVKYKIKGDLKYPYDED